MSMNQVWCCQHFSGVPLSDKRRIKRVQTVAAALAENFGHSIPQLFEKPYDVKATYNLFKHPEATPKNLQARHRKRVMHHFNEPGTALFVLEDTTELSWARKKTQGLGPVGHGSPWHKGFLLHSVLAVRWTGEPDSAPRWRSWALPISNTISENPLWTAMRRNSEESRPGSGKGMIKLQALVAGARLGLQLIDFGKV